MKVIIGGNHPSYSSNAFLCFFFLHKERNLIATTLACENAKTIYRLEDYLAASFDASFPSEVKSIVFHLLFYRVIFKDKI